MSYQKRITWNYLRYNKRENSSKKDRNKFKDYRKLNNTKKKSEVVKNPPQRMTLKYRPLILTSTDDL